MTDGPEEPVPLDVGAIRDDVIRLNGLTGVDDVRTFYYDESNNLRRLHVTPQGLNVREPQVFVLGGIVHGGAPRDLGFDGLRQALRLQPTVDELKFEHIAKGDFPNALRSRKLTTFLEWLLSSDLLVHYIALDPLYWSIVDIVESVTAIEPTTALFAPRLKSDLYNLLRIDVPGMVDLFRRYGYPDVGPSGPTFMAELLELLDARRDLVDDFGYEMLRQCLRVGERAGELPFLENETANTLIDTLAPFVIHRICLFKNSTHVLDIEPVIRRRLDKLRFVDGDRQLAIHSFVTSHEDPGVQISDGVLGLLGKCLSWLNRTCQADVVVARSEFGGVQETNRRLLAELLERSAEETAAFAQRVVSVEDAVRGSLLLGG